MGKPTLHARPDARESAGSTGQVEEAIDVAAEHLAGFPESALACPGIAQLCLRAGQPERLARIAREQGDLRDLHGRAWSMMPGNRRTTQAARFSIKQPTTRRPKPGKPRHLWAETKDPRRSCKTAPVGRAHPSAQGEPRFGE